MKAILLKILPGTALSALMLVSAVTWSGGFPRGPGLDDGRMLAHLGDELELDDSQQQEIRTLVKASREAGRADFERMREIHQALTAMRGDFNAGEAQRLSTELGEISARTAYRMAETNSKVFAILSPEQQQELDEIKAEHRERGKGKRHPGHDPE